jgi:hypothetical protein
LSSLVFTYDNRIRIQVSAQAQRLIGKDRLAEFLKALTRMLDALGVERAYVTKDGVAIVINMLLPDQTVGWLNIPVKKQEA